MSLSGLSMMPQSKLSGPAPFPRIIMSASSATMSSSPVVSMAALGGGRVPSAPGAPTPGSGKCCENGRPVSTDPITGQTICSCQYNPGALLMAASCYPRGVGIGVPGLGEAAGVYASPYAAMQGLLPGSAGADPTAAFYSSMGALQGSAGYYAYDPFSGYPYGNGFSMDPNARRKNATRESTQTLKAWLSEHRKNPYPTKGEKIMLAIITKMTLTQVSTWFANARRRLKKENKMTWSPRNRCGEDDDDMDNDDLDDDNKLNDDDRDENDTNNNRDFADNASENNDVDILNCDRDRDFISGDVRKSSNNPHILSHHLSEDCSRDINVLDDDDEDSSAPSGKEHQAVNKNIGSAFTLVSPSRVSGLNGHRPGSPRPHSRSTSPGPEHSHQSKIHDAIERMRSGAEKLTPSAPTQKPKIWSVADVVSKSPSSEDRSEKSPSASPLHLQMNGGHLPHPAFPSHAGPGAPNHGLSMASRGMGLWNPSVVTSLAGMAAAGRFHPYGQGLFSQHGGSPGSLPTSRPPFPGHGLPGPMVPGLMAGHHPLGVHPGLLTTSQQPTDLRKISPTAPGRPSTVSPDAKSLGVSPRDGALSKSLVSPLLPTAFKPVPRSSASLSISS